MYKPYRLQGEVGAVQIVPMHGQGNSMPPSNAAIAAQLPPGWQPGQHQNTASIRGQQKLRTPAVRPVSSFRLIG